MSEPAPARKPIRVWLLQLTCVLQFIRTVLLVVNDLRTMGGLRDAVDAMWFAQAFFWSCFLVGLVLALQRLLPRPGVAAPALACVWWTHGVVLHIQDWVAIPPPRAVDAVAVGGILAQVFMLWLAGSLIFHRKTRAYLNDPASEPGSEGSSV